MITVVLTEDEVLRVMNFIEPVTERWPDERALANALRKLDDALLAYEELKQAVRA